MLVSRIGGVEVMPNGLNRIHGAWEFDILNGAKNACSSAGPRFSKGPSTSKTTAAFGITFTIRLAFHDWRSHYSEHGTTLSMLPCGHTQFELTSSLQLERTIDGSMINVFVGQNRPVSGPSQRV